MDTIITSKDWKQAESLYDLVSKQVLPVRIEEQIFFDMLEAVPPIEWAKTRSAFASIKIPIQEYFLAGEAYTIHKGCLMYGCFARAFDTKYYFVGYLPVKKYNII